MVKGLSEIIGYRLNGGFALFRRGVIALLIVLCSCSPKLISGDDMRVKEAKKFNHRSKIDWRIVTVVVFVGIATGLYYRDSK